MHQWRLFGQISSLILGGLLLIGCNRVIFEVYEVTDTPAVQEAASVAETSTVIPTPVPTATPPAATPTVGASTTVAEATESDFRIAFMTDRDGDLEIYVMDQDGEDLTNLTNHVAVDGLPAWSPEAEMFAFLTSRDSDEFSIYGMKADGSEPILLTGELNINTSIQPRWNAAGDLLAFGSGVDVYLVDPTGEILINVTDSSAEDNFKTWSPDGRQLLFTSDRDGVVAIYLINIGENEPVRLTESLSNNGEPAWSPNGETIAFMSDRSGDIEIFVMNTTGENISQLTNNQGFDGFPIWSPDGSQIAFLSLRDGDPEIYVMDADGSNPTNLTNSPTSRESLQGDFSWSPDGRQIMFHSDRDGDVEVYVMDADGNNKTNLTNSPATDLGAIWIR